MGDFNDPFLEMAYGTSADFPLARTPSLGCHQAIPNSREAGKCRLSLSPGRREISSVISLSSQIKSKEIPLYTKQKIESIKGSQNEWQTGEPCRSQWNDGGVSKQERRVIRTECHGFSAF